MNALSYSWTKDAVSPLQAVICEKKPAGFSDPGGDFQTASKQVFLSRILSKDAGDLDLADFLMIFQHYLPAGTYEECAYYLPYAMAFIGNHLDCPDTCDLMGSLHFWVFDNKERLQEAGFLPYYESWSLDIYKRAFSVSPFDGGEWTAFQNRMEMVNELFDNFSCGRIPYSMVERVMDHLDSQPVLMRALGILSVLDLIVLAYELVMEEDWTEEDYINPVPVFCERFSRQGIIHCRRLLGDYVDYCPDSGLKEQLEAFLDRLCAFVHEEAPVNVMRRIFDESSALVWN